ncbi:hypothetical protein B0T25DRAFT_556568 [Lasiosphaeria hispida]|uniref:Large ribosomal subunit protein bL32m n=1 Tax=Lasiosphaeria hispida TaxID=260671 RepID=A0AAJ0M9U9_9PEZI|nr:hypothetical protein B0T25DRAFT_556568 [Lasiosphaeria hispida]
MATQAMRIASSSSMLPRLLSPGFLSASRATARVNFQQFSLPLFPTVAVTIPVGFQLGLPSIPSMLEDIWESILKAVPKKKTSHSKTRSRQMAGKALKDVTALCKCPACGDTKRMHHVCPQCAKKLNDMMQKEMVAK